MALVGRTTSNAITTRVVGGIGNQLFCYFAGYYLAKKLGLDLRVDVSDIRHKRSVHDVSIEALELPGNYFAEPNGKIQTFFNRLAKKLIKAHPILNKTGMTYISTEIGFDPDLDLIEAPKSIEGYFQSYKYYQACSGNKLNIGLRTPSEWFIDIERQIKSKKFTAIHIRRGDYLSHSKTYGLLNSDYYKRAMENLRSRNHLHQLYVFSDSIELARELLFDLAPLDTVWVKPPSESNPVESLLLMSKAASVIIANSTFSWWGAALNKNEPFVIAPKKWFRSMNDPAGLYPPDWHLIESGWEV
jgi:Glycosyl transferase family 11